MFTHKQIASLQEAILVVIITDTAGFFYCSSAKANPARLHACNNLTEKSCSQLISLSH